MLRPARVLAAAALLLVGCPRPQDLSAQVTELQAAVEKELPKGSSVARVKAFLDKRGIEYSDVVRATQTLYAKTKEEPIAFGTQVVLLEFRFDQQGTMREFSVKPGITGP